MIEERRSTQPVITLLWVVLGLAAGALRLTGLGAAPLSAAEATLALAAYRAAHAIGTPAALSLPASGYSPLLLHANIILFALFDSSDGLARLLPALAGTFLVLTPRLLRRFLGEWGALGMALFLALSPTFLLASRTLDPTTCAALGVMLLLGGVARFATTRETRFVTLSGGALALALTAGAEAWGLLLGPLLALAGSLRAWRTALQWARPLVRPLVARFLAALGLGLLVMGGGLGLHLPGLAAIGDQFLAWLALLHPFGPSSSPSPALLLPAYEPLLLLAGLAGLATATGRRRGPSLLLALWAAVGGAQLALMPGAKPTDLAWVLLPLAGLGGLAAERLVRSLQTHGQWLNEGLHLPISLALWVHCGLNLAGYARNGDPIDQMLVGLTLLLQLLLTAVFGFAVSAPQPEETSTQAARRGLATAMRAGGLSLGTVLLFTTFSAAWGLTHLRPTDPRELLAQGATAMEVRTLTAVTEQVAVLNTGLETGLPVTFVGEPDPAVAWALRQFDQQVVSSPSAAQQPPLLLTPPQPSPPGYFGESFTLHRAWLPHWSGPETARWLLYRETITPPVTTDQVILWVRTDLGTAAQDQ